MAFSVRPACIAWNATISGGVSGNASRAFTRSEDHTSELQSPCNLACRLLLEQKKDFTAPDASHARGRRRGCGCTSQYDYRGDRYLSIHGTIMPIVARIFLPFFVVADAALRSF